MRLHCQFSEFRETDKDESFYSSEMNGTQWETTLYYIYYPNEYQNQSQIIIINIFQVPRRLPPRHCNEMQIIFVTKNWFHYIIVFCGEPWWTWCITVHYAPHNHSLNKSDKINSFCFNYNFLQHGSVSFYQTFSGEKSPLQIIIKNNKNYNFCISIQTTKQIHFFKQFGLCTRYNCA